MSSHRVSHCLNSIFRLFLPPSRYQSAAGLIVDLRILLSAVSASVSPSTARPLTVPAAGSRATSGPDTLGRAPSGIASLASFEAGQLDQVSTFRLSQKLYGREKEVELLRNAYTRIAQAPTLPGTTVATPTAAAAAPATVAPHLFLISGYSGVVSRGQADRRS